MEKIGRGVGDILKSLGEGIGKRARRVIKKRAKQRGGMWIRREEIPLKVILLKMVNGKGLVIHQSPGERIVGESIIVVILKRIGIEDNQIKEKTDTNKRVVYKRTVGSKNEIHLAFVGYKQFFNTN